MPRLQLRAPTHDRNFSLGWLATAWMEFFCLHGDGDVLGEPVLHGAEYTGIIVDAYALHPPGTVSPTKVGRRLYDSVFLSRPKGCDKSGLGARFGMFEALGPCRFAGIAKGGEVYRDPWGLGFKYTYRPGEPMGRHIRSPFIRCMATEEQQTGNVYDNIYFNLTEGLLAGAMRRRDDAGLTRVILPDRGEVTPSTASGASKDGGKETFVDFDESHLYDTPELRRMYATVTRNLRKRKKIAETWFLETTTMFAVGDESIAEKTYALAEAMMEGKTKRKDGLFVDHRWGECEDVTDEEQLRAALRDAYGDAMAWHDEDSLVDEFHDPRAEEEDSRRYFLNAKTSHTHAYVRAENWDAVRLPADDPRRTVEPGETITLGFDGSRKRSRGVTDATALIGCRVRDGYLFTIGVWEQPMNLGKNKDGTPKTWQVPHALIDAKVHETFEKYRVVGFYADPAKWETYVANWEAKYRSRLKVKSTVKNPIEWWMVGGEAKKVYGALESFYDGIIEKQLCHGSAPTQALTRHMLNARRLFSKSGYGIHKEHPNSPKKIDAAVAAVLAYQARLDALAKGVTAPKRPRQVPVRIR
jgi:hypothetical protein